MRVKLSASEIIEYSAMRTGTAGEQLPVEFEYFNFYFGYK